MENRRRTFGMTLRPYRYDDFSDVRDLYKDVWKEQRGLNYDRVRMRDTFDGLPLAVTAHFGENLGGFFTIWPMPLTDGRQSVSGGQAMDVMTAERFRGKGVFPTLAAQAVFDARDRGMKVLIGVPNEAVLDTYIKRLAWATPTQVRTSVRPLSARGKHRLLGIADPIFASLPIGRTSGFMTGIGRPTNNFLEQTLSAAPRKKGVWKVERSIAWYDFRYQENERFDYRWVWAKSDSAGTSFALWGVERDHNSLRRANLLDIVGSTDHARSAVVAAACRQAKLAGAAFISATCTLSATSKWLQRRSFIPIKRSPLIVKTLDPSPFAANPYQDDSWDLFGGDFDFV